ncbi:TetR/AcrR family transcriptional regulator [Hahella ganghwensis]|uniref:TetR/AcrR family transcriptional regulator n=1 Tax=Hahella ganghwensis TaxID=286420 RepID=UPI00036694C7|nr:TetR/AcrR family transcriptional regulator [Hahella ganghwensis]
MRVVPKQSRSQAKIDLILTTTASMLIEAGADAITMSDIATRCDLPIGTLYHYFPNKNEVLKTLAEISINKIDEELSEAITQASMSKIDWMSLVDMVFEAYRESPGLLPLLQAIKAIPELRDIVDQSNARVAEVLADHVDPANRLPSERRQLVCRLISELVQSCLEYALIQCADPVRIKEISNELKVMLSALQNHYFQ